MFGLFGGKSWNQYNIREVVLNISSAALNTLGSSFLAQRECLSDYTLWTSPDNVFIPPKGFWEDEYILGFVNNLVQGLLSAEMQRLGIPRTPKNIGRIIAPILKAICSDHYLGVMARTSCLIKEENYSIEGEPTLFMVDIMSGSVYSKIITGRINEVEEFLGDIVDKAKSFCQKTREPYPSILCFLFKQETLDSYIKEHYPLEKLREERTWQNS